METDWSMALSASSTDITVTDFVRYVSKDTTPNMVINEEYQLFEKLKS
jgi:hypothetical protein